MNKFVFLPLLFGVSGGLFSPVQAAVFTRISGENGRVIYDISRDQGVGWYKEPSSSYRFNLIFKQANRFGSNPIGVASVASTAMEHYRGNSAISIEILAHDMRHGGSATYKAAIRSVGNKDVFAPAINTPRIYFHGFAMKIDPESYQLPTGLEAGAVIFEQWWQGSPFHPPISLAIMNEQQVMRHQWKDANPHGNFVLILRDDDNKAYEKSPGKQRILNLGPVRLGAWMQWVVGVRPDPSGKQGSVEVWLDGVKKAGFQELPVGYDPDRYPGPEKPLRTLAVDCCIYRPNGQSAQKFYFDEIRFTDNYAEASAP